MEERSAFLKRVSFGMTLDDQVIAALADIAQALERPAGTLIQLEGEPAQAMYIVSAGQVKIARLSPGGREQVLHIVGVGSHFNMVSVFDGGPCPANAEAQTDVALLALPSEAMRQVVERYPALALALLAEFAGRLRHLVDLVDDLALHTVQGRLAGLLLDQAERTSAGEALPPLTQAEMAARLGTVREMIGRTLKSFEGQGLISMQRGSITLLDREGLQNQAQR